MLPHLCYSLDLESFPSASSPSHGQPGEHLILYNPAPVSPSWEGLHSTSIVVARHMQTVLSRKGRGQECPVLSGRSILNIKAKVLVFTLNVPENHWQFHGQRRFVQEGERVLRKFAKELKEKEKNGKGSTIYKFMWRVRKFDQLANERIVLPILQVEIRLLIPKSCSGSHSA